MQQYFSALPRGNDVSISAHIAIACFLAAAHRTMLTWLKRKSEAGLNGPRLLEWWHRLMEKRDGEVEYTRETFFSAVVQLAREVTNFCLTYRLKIHVLLPAPREKPEYQGR